MEILKKTIGLFLFVFIQISFFILCHSVDNGIVIGWQECWENVNIIYNEFVIIFFYIFFTIHNILNYKIYNSFKEINLRDYYIRNNIFLFVLFYLFSYLFYFYVDGGSNGFMIVFYLYTVIYFSILIYNLTIKKIKTNRIIYFFIILFSSILILNGGVFIIKSINYNERECRNEEPNLLRSYNLGADRNV
jgi:hypothetical protein